VGVSDAELVAGIKLLAQSTGVFTETAGGATLAAAASLVRAGRLGPDDEVVLCITGNGLKTIEALDGALSNSPVIAARLKEVSPLVAQAQQTALAS
jgi:threonine synthase